ncbi:hypothetical protein L798_10264 [Zootermopsis nevadensis]|uniref:Ionotropic glutamate receptor C-terminal domain-containing protein n=1 Tax=Zootermopsis nevadensis TaxID=136037 RepID=A0A067RJB6_ZOONE|nr:hypothetical protein L798_10264 [Zootermopsis nevadensis]
MRAESCYHLPHLIDCIETISNRFFPPRSSVVLSVPSRLPNSELLHKLSSRHTDTTGLLLKRLHHSVQRPIVVFHTGCVKVPCYNHDKHGSYILWTSVGIGTQLRQLKSYGDAWNPNTRFLVVWDDPIVDNRRQMQAIVEEMIRWKILNVIILVPSKDGEEEFDVYTWFPYQPPSGNCGNFVNVILLDKWINKNGGYFSKNASLYQEKIPRDLMGCPITAATIALEPHVISDQHKNGTTYNRGLDVRIFLHITQTMNASAVFTPPTPELWGRKIQNGSWTGIFGEVYNNRADIAFSSTMLVITKFGDLDFTTPYGTANFVWVVPCAKPYPPWSSITRVFSTGMWILVFVVVILAAAVMLCLSVFSANTSHEVELYKNMCGCLTSAWAVLLGTSVVKMPVSIPLRLFFILWVSCSLAVNTVFQTFVTTYLVNPGQQKQIDSVKSLLDSGIYYGFHPDMDAFLMDDTNLILSEILKQREACSNIVSCLQRVAEKCDFATLLSSDSVHYMNTYKFLDRSGKGLLCTIKAPAFTAYKTFYLPKHSKYRKILNRMIAVANEAGLINYWWKEILITSRIKAGSIKRHTLQDDYSVFLLTHLQGAFYLLMLGHFISSSCFVGELIFHWLRSM